MQKLVVQIECVALETLALFDLHLHRRGEGLAIELRGPLRRPVNAPQRQCQEQRERRSSDRQSASNFPHANLGETSYTILR
jgi:hypothetical protein